MADELPGSFGKTREDLVEQRVGIAERTSLDHADHAVRSEHSGALGAIAELARESMEHSHLPIALPELRLSFELPRGQSFDRNDRIADGADSTNPRGSQQDGQNFRKNVRMFMSIEVSDFNSGGLNLSDLRRDFFNQLIAIEASEHGAGGEG